MIDVFPDECEVYLWNRLTMGSLLCESDRIRVIEDLCPDIIVHLAWMHTGTRSYTEEIENLTWSKASFAFAKECINSSARFLTLGSPLDLPNLNIVKSNKYAMAKRELRINMETTLPEHSYTLLRPGYIFSVEHLRPRLIENVAHAIPAVYESIQNPNAVHEFIHVSDVVSAIKIALLQNLWGTINLGGIKTSVEDFVSVLGLRGDFSFPMPRSINMIEYCPADSLLSESGWNPERTIQHFSDFL